MRPGMRTVCGAILVAPTVLLMTWGGGRSLGDEPGRLGRLFRFGGGSGLGARPADAAAVPSPRPDPSRFGSPLLFDAGASRRPRRRLGSSPGLA